MAVFSDASFACSLGVISQLGYLTITADARGNGNLRHYRSEKSKRLTRKVLAAKRFAAVLAFDFVSTLRKNLNDLFSRVVPLVLRKNSKSMFDSAFELNSTTEK